MICKLHFKFRLLSMAVGVTLFAGSCAADLRDSAYAGMLDFVNATVVEMLTALFFPAA